MSERMTDKERAYAEKLLAGCLLGEFRTLLNPELAKQMARLAIEKVIVFQGYTGKQL